MRYPSVKTLRLLFGDKAPLARRIIDGRADPCTVSERAAAYQRRCYSPPDRLSLQLVALDELAGTHGVEAIRKGDETVAEYLNAGDTYNTTLLYSYVHRDAWQITCWGDFVERYERRHGRLS